MRFAEWEACIAAHLDIWRWERGFYSLQFKAYVMTWYDLHCLINSHQEDAKARKQDEESRKK